MFRWRLMVVVCFVGDILMDVACRRQPKRQLKRLYDAQDAAETAEADNDNDNDEEDLMEPVFGKDVRLKRADPPIGHMSGLGPSDDGLQGELLCLRLFYHGMLTIRPYYHVWRTCVAVRQVPQSGCGSQTSQSPWWMWKTALIGS